jgi:hypothetical protein
LSKLLDSVRDAAAARRALNAEKPPATAHESPAHSGVAAGDDSPLMMAMRRANALNQNAQSGDETNAAVQAEANLQREMERAHNAIGAAQSREAIDRGAATLAKRQAAAEAAARQLVLERIDAEKSAETAALARVAAEEQAARAATERAQSERDAEEAAKRKADAERASIEAAHRRAQVDAEAEVAAAARASAEAALQVEIEARIAAERSAAERERARLRAEELAAQAAAARAALEAQRAAELNAPLPAQSRSFGTGARAKAMLSRHGAALAGATAVLLAGIAIGDWAGRNAVIEAKVAPRAMQETADVHLRIDGDVEAFSQRLQTRVSNKKAAPRKNAQDNRAH